MVVAFFCPWVAGPSIPCPFPVYSLARVERDTSKRIWFLCLSLVIISYSVAAAKGGVEDERVLLSLGGGKNCATMMELESTLCFLFSHQEKGGGGFNSNMKI